MYASQQYAPAAQGSAGALPGLLALANLPAELAEVRRELGSLRAFLTEFLGSIDDQIGYKEALKITGIKSRTTLTAERSRPGTLLTFTQHGRSVAYSRAGCVAYKLAHQIGGERRPQPWKA